MRNQNGHLDIELNNLFVEQEISKQAYGQHSQEKFSSRSDHVKFCDIYSIHHSYLISYFTIFT